MRLILIFCLLFNSFISFAQDWKTINGRSMVEYKAGNFIEAIRLADRALIMAEADYGMISTQYLSSLSNKAYAQAGAGDYLKALANYRTAARLSFALYSLPHVEQVQTLTELSKTFLSLAAYDSTEHYLSLARSVYISVPQKNKLHADTSSLELSEAYLAVNNTEASLRHKKGQVNEAIRLLKDQEQMLKDLYADFEESSDYQTTLSNLATYYIEVDDLEQAAHYARYYYELVKKADRQRDIIYALQNLGSIARKRELSDSALYYWNKAVNVAEGGAYRHSYVHTVLLNNIGELLISYEDYDKAIEMLESSLAIQDSREALQPYLYRTTQFNLAEGYFWSGEYEKADTLYSRLIRALVDDVQHNFTFLSDNEKISFYNQQQEIVNSYLSFALNISGVLPLQQGDNPYINPDIAGKLYDLQLTTKAIILNASKRMRNAILTSGDTLLVKVYHQWEERKNQLAQALVSGQYSEEQLRPWRESIEESEKWLTVHSRSFQNGFEVERVTWQQVQRKLKRGEAAVELIRLVDGLLYGALIVTTETKRPVFSLVMSTKSKHLERQFFQQYYNAIVQRLPDTLSYNTYWKPVVDSIRSYLPGGMMPTRVYLSNDGIYNQINVNTLKHPATGKYVIDETEIVLLTNTKEIVISEEQASEPDKRTAALFGQPQFSFDAGGQQLFADLPGTGVEIHKVAEALTAERWQTAVYLHDKATEENLKQLNKPSVLHLATHGYFSTADKGASLADVMIRSGVVLAGAADKSHKGEDGLLTALEVTSLNLEDTRLVVLSACDTGRGTLNNGDGVYGLQRAVRVAGASNLVMSLWKVDDEATQKLMTDFYQRWLKTGNMRQSFAEAQRALRVSHPDPYFWGAFVLAGQ